MPDFKDMTEQRAVPVSEQELRTLLESNAWLAICQYARVQQKHLHSGIKNVQPDMRLLMYQHIDLIDDFLSIPGRIREHNPVDEAVETKTQILAHLREQLKGDIEQWKPKE